MLPKNNNSSFLKADSNNQKNQNPNTPAFSRPFSLTKSKSWNSIVFYIPSGYVFWKNVLNSLVDTRSLSCDCFVKNLNKYIRRRFCPCCKTIQDNLTHHVVIKTKNLYLKKQPKWPLISVKFNSYFIKF